MKKIISIIAFTVTVLHSQAQFLNSMAITLGATAANQHFHYRDPVAISRKGYVFGMNASVFLELFSHDNARWVTEIQYNQKGSIDKRPEATYGNRLQYLSWNNYLKLRYEMYSIIPYVLVGPRLEYTLSQASGSPDTPGSYLPLHVSLAAGGGVELVSFTNFKFFVEGFYVPDVMPAYISSPVHVTNKDFELRVGLKYEFAGRKESCNTPTYVE